MRRCAKVIRGRWSSRDRIRCLEQPRCKARVPTAFETDTGWQRSGTPERNERGRPPSCLPAAPGARDAARGGDPRWSPWTPRVEGLEMGVGRLRWLDFEGQRTRGGTATQKRDPGQLRRTRGLTGPEGKPLKPAQGRVQPLLPPAGWEAAWLAGSCFTGGRLATLSPTRVPPASLDTQHPTGPGCSDVT